MIEFLPDDDDAASALGYGVGLTVEVAEVTGLPLDGVIWVDPL